MKRLMFLLLLMFSFSSAAEDDLTTFVKYSSGGLELYTFTGTNTAAQNFFDIFPSQGYFDADDVSDVITLRYSTGETSLDSIRWTVTFEAKVSATASWFTLATFTDDSTTTPFLHVFDPLTYGKWPFVKFRILGNASQNAIQTLTGQVTFDKD
ncbi:MAG: hypothetical protein ACUZ8H_00165 [Candidatus Anammoxibacter sp.]